VKALVLGGHGAVGAEMVSELRVGGDDCLVAGRDPARADRLVDLREPGAASYRTALTNVDVVVNAAGIENPALAAIAAEHGAAFVDITATSGYVAALERLRPPRPVLVSVGLAPGLTNLLAAAVHDSEPGPIDIALLVGAGERHGAAATAWSYGLLGKRFRDPDGASRTPQDLHLPGTDRWLALARAAGGTTRWAAGRGQSHATAVMTAVAARAAVRLPAAVHHLHTVLTLADVPAGRGIELGPIG
jgi:hypothetical protein